MLKRIELAMRRFLIRTLCLAMRQPRSVPDWGSRRHTVLFLRPDRVGDMILTTSLLRAIATSHPTIRLDVLASPANAVVLQRNPNVGFVRVFDRRRPWTWPRVVRELRSARYDAVIDCMVFSPSLTLMLLMAASGAALRIGIGGRINDAAYGLPVAKTAGPEAHHIEHLADLASPFGVDLDAFDWRPEVFLSREELDFAERLWSQQSSGGAGGMRFLLNISAASERRRWPEDRFIAAIRGMLMERPALRVLIIGMPQHAARLRQIAEATGCETASPGLRQTLALVATANVFLTPDTGLVHAASAFKTPFVGLYPRGKSIHWGPYQTPARLVNSADRTLEPLSAEAVIVALRELIDSVEAERARVG